MKTLKTRIATKLANCYLLQGDDYYLYDKAFAMIKKACDLSLEDFNLIKFDDENFSMQAFLDSCEVMPMGCDKKIILVKNVSKINESDKKKLSLYLESPVLSTVIVVFDYQSKFDFIKKQAEIVDCKRFDKKLLAGVVVNELKKRNKQISGEALELLSSYCSGYLTRIMCEIDKLCYYDISQPLITSDIVDTMVTKDNDFVVFELTEALGKKDGDKALSLLDKMIKEPGVLGLITNHFRRLFFIATSCLNDVELASLLGVKEFAIAKQKAQTKNFSKVQLKKIYQLLEQVDMSIKSGAMLQENALYYLVISILYI